MNYTLTDKGLVTSDPVIAAMFLGKELEYNKILTAITDNTNSAFYVFDLTEQDDEIMDNILIPRSLIAEAINPVEGGGYIYDAGKEPSWKDLTISILSGHHNSPRSYHKRILNFVTTRSELREFVKWLEKGK